MYARALDGTNIEVVFIHECHNDETKYIVVSQSTAPDA